MSDLPIALPLLERFGLEAIQHAADLALGPGVLKVTADDTGIGLALDLGQGHRVAIGHVGVGPHGVRGRVSLDGISPAAPLQATLFGGFVIGLTRFEAEMADGAFSLFEVAGLLQIPFFTNSDGSPKSVAVELTLRGDGSLALTLAAADPANQITEDGLVRLVYTIGGAVVLELHIASLEGDKLPDGNWRIVLSGRLGLTTADLEWPSFDLHGLGIDTHGNILLEGGWIDLPSQTALDFYGFHVALHRLGFGSDPGGRWLGFNGDIHLVEGLSLGGSVRGLRINLDTGALSFDGVGIAFEVPSVLSITGEIDHIHVDANTPDDLALAGLLPSLFDQITNAAGQPALPKKVDVFAGSVDVAIEALPGLEINGRFIVGHFGGVSVFFLAIDAELPVGIPIFLDVSLYGVQGLFASNLEPHPEPDHTWWEWFKYPTGPGGIDTTAPPDYDATAVAKWLAPRDGALAFGAGATIGTSVDDGFTASAAITLVLMLPGPVVTLIGKANILSKRIGGAKQDANFDALAVYDVNIGTFDLTIDAHYGIPIVLEIDGTAELHVTKNPPAPNPSWFLALGRPPHEKRLKARVFDIFESDAYLVVSDRGLVTGTWSGYRGSWSFGPLSVSLDAYMATLAAIQWSPLQIAGGIEMHGEVHLEAFGIGLGLTVDALLEGCAPNPFWVHGEFSVELDLPWPLPDVGASVSLSWGGDDGSVPPAPLPLGRIDATLADHLDRAAKPASDRYALLAHRAGFPAPEPAPRYDDPAAPGLLAPDAASRTAWHALVDGHDPRNPADLQSILPRFDPVGVGAQGYAPLLPQDSHFVLGFAHPVFDAAGFLQAQTPPPEVVTVDVPPIVGKDDMSNLSVQTPAVQWLYRHTLTQVALYRFDAGAWHLVCAFPEIGPPGPIRLTGVWLTPPTADPQQQRQTLLKVVPYTLLPGEPRSAVWTGEPQGKNYASDFTDKGLHFVADPGLTPVAILAVSATGNVPGLGFGSPRSSNTGTVRISFPGAVQVTAIVGMQLIYDGEFTDRFAPDWLADGTHLVPESSTQDLTTGQWTQRFPIDVRAIRELTTRINLGMLLLFALDYRRPDIRMPILPSAPTLYALRSATRIEAGRVSNGSANLQVVDTGDPVLESAYFQTASGPGSAVIGGGAPAPAPLPAQAPPFPTLAANALAATLPPNQAPTGQQPSTAFPLGGSLLDLGSYAQWSSPADGEPAAYFGYDLGVEFTETYVNALYTAFSGGSVGASLHFRCVDRNQRHTLLQPAAIHVDSMPQLSALVAQPLTLPLPAVLQPPAAPGIVITPGVLSALKQRATLAAGPPGPVLPALELSPPSLPKQMATRLATRAGVAEVPTLDPKVAAGLLAQSTQQEDAVAARALWFRPLQPRTRYTFDIVAGPLSGAAGPGSLSAVFGASDASTLLTALRAWQAHEDALTPLLRVQFTTSRYASFSDQLANVSAQIAGTSATGPIRRAVAAADPLAWLADSSHGVAGRVAAASAYDNARAALANVVASYDPLADALRADGSAAPNGARALCAARASAEQAWAAFTAASTASFEGLIAALGRPDLVATAKPIRAPETELSVFTDAARQQVLALLLESPEPLSWRRIWRWVAIGPDESQAKNVVLWNADGRLGLVVITGKPEGSYPLSILFQGNIGAEAPCITRAGDAVTESVVLGTLVLGPGP